MGAAPASSSARRHAYDLVGRSAFRVVRDADAEHRKLNVIRALVGLLLALRVGFIGPTAVDVYGSSSGEALWSLGMFALACLLALGIATPIVTLALIVALPAYDTAIGATNLGSLVLVFLLIYMLLAGGGSTVSVDGWLMRRPGRLARLVAVPYRLIGIADARRLTVLGFVLFLAYAAISFGAVLHHLDDPAWRNGEGIGVMLTSSYWSRVYEPARWLEQHAHGLMHIQSVLVTGAQLVWQLLMVPLALTRWGNRFVAVWGTVFVVTSLLFFQLSELPALEACLWAVVFLPALALPARRSRLRSLGPAPPAIAGVPAVAGVLLAVWLTAIGLFLVELPQLRLRLQDAGLRYQPPLEDRIAELLPRLGLLNPDVFNLVDLRSGDYWAVLRRADGSLVPYDATDGHRLALYRSDLVLYGSSVPWRRSVQDLDPVAAHRAGQAPRAIIEGIARLDHTRHGGSGRYTVQVYRSFASDYTMDAGERFRAHVVASFKVAVP